MRLSARNSLKGTVTAIHTGEIEAEVTIEVAPGVEVVATVTRASVRALGLAVGQPAYAVIKASSVMVGVD